MLGISQQVASQFAEKNRFPEGVTRVDVTVNDMPTGAHTARFNRHGALCADDDLLQVIGVQAGNVQKSASCPALSERIKQSSVELDPGLQAIHILIPASQQQRAPTRWAQGGAAAMLNYQLYSSRDFHRQGSQWDYANLESGFNWHNWAIRHFTTLHVDNDKFERDRGWLYARRVLEAQRQQLQVGEINLSTPLIGGVPLQGLQLIPWSPLQTSRGDSTIEGVARSNPSRVEVMQSGKLIYATRVPAGPFSLNDVPLLNRTSDVTLRITGSDGSQEVRQLLPADYLNRQAVAEGWHLALGKTASTTMPSVWLIAASQTKELSRQASLTVAGMATARQQQLAASLNLTPWQSLQFDGQMVSDLDQAKPDSMMIQLGNFLTLPNGLSFDAHYGVFGKDYHPINAVPIHHRRQVLTAGISWSQPELGQLSVHLTQTQEHGKLWQSRTLSWQREIWGNTMMVSWQDDASNSRGHSGSSLWFNLTRSLGKHSLSSFYQRNNKSQLRGIGSSGELSPQSSYNLALEQDERSDPGMSGNVSTTLHSVSTSVSASSGADSQLSGSLSGGMVFHSHGLTFSPRPISETFAIAQLSPPVSDVRFDTPGGPVWSDSQGQAVIADAGSYQTGQIELNTETLPHHVDVNNGLRQVNNGFATVSQLNFTLIKTRGALIHVTLASGKPLPKGSAITTPEGRFVTTAVEDGTLFVPNVESTPELIAHWGDTAGQQCQLHWALPHQQPTDLPFDTVTADCH